MTDTNPSRRLFLAAGSAGAVFGALSQAASASDDPIFAAIAEQRRCKALADEALAVCNRAGDELDAARDAIAVVRFKGERYQSVGHLDGAVSLKGSLSVDEIAEYYKARAALKDHETAFMAAFEKSGIEEAEDAFGERNKAYFDAEMAVLATPPVTAAGAMALLAFLTEHLEGPHRDPGWDYPEPLLGAIRNTLSVLMGEAQA